jgi:hypothetical protein
MAMRCPRVRCCSRFGYRTNSMLRELLRNCIVDRHNNNNNTWYYKQLDWMLWLGLCVCAQVCLLCVRLAEIVTFSWFLTFAPIFVLFATLLLWPCMPTFRFETQRDHVGDANEFSIISGVVSWWCVFTPLLTFFVLLCAKLDGLLGSHIGMRHIVIPLFFMAGLSLCMLCAGLSDAGRSIEAAAMCCAWCLTIGMILTFEVLMAVYYDTADHGTVRYATAFIPLFIMTLFCTIGGALLCYSQSGDQPRGGGIITGLCCCFKTFNERYERQRARRLIGDSKQNVNVDDLVANGRGRWIPAYVA